MLTEHLWYHPHEAGAYNFGPHPHGAATVRQVVELARQAYGGGQIVYADGPDGPHEAGFLALETAKVRTLLKFRPR